MRKQVAPILCCRKNQQLEAMLEAESFTCQVVSFMTVKTARLSLKISILLPIPGSNTVAFVETTTVNNND